MKRKIKGLLNIFLYYLFFCLNFLPVKSNEILNIGNENAKITVKVFSSLTCPHCASFHNKVFNNLKKEYIDTLGKIKFEHHSFPLDLAALKCGKSFTVLYKNKEKSFQFLSEIYTKNKINGLLDPISIL